MPGRGRRGGVPHAARFPDPRAPVPRPRRPALCCLPQLRGPGAARAEVLRASPIRPGASSFAHSRHPLSARGSDTRARDSQLGGPRRSFLPSRVRRPQQHLSPGPAPPGRVGPGWGSTAPPPQRPTQQWGRGQPPLLATVRQARSQRRGWGASPPPMPPESRGRSVGPGWDRRLGLPGLAGGCRSPSAVPAAGPEERRRQAAADRHDRGPAPRRPPARSPASCLRSSSADCSSVILPAEGPGWRRGFRRAGDRLWRLPGLGVLRKPGPHDGSAEAKGGRAGRRSGASLPVRVRLVQLSSQPHARKGRVPGPPRRALGFRSPASLLQPARRPHRCLPPPQPHCAQGRSAQARWGCLLRDRPASKPYPSASLPRLCRRDPAPYAHLPGSPPSWEGRRPADCQGLRR